MSFEQTLLLRPELASLPKGLSKLWIKSREVPGLYLEVREGSVRTWFGYLAISGKQFRKKLGNALTVPYSEAKELFQAWANSFAEEPPIRTRAQAFTTVEDAFLIYYGQHVSLNNARPKEIAAGVNRYWGAISKRLVVELSSNIVQEWLSDLARRFGKETANRQLNTLKACVNFVADREYVTLHRDPFRSVKRFKSQAKENYLRKGEEHDRLMALLDADGGPQAKALKMMLWTGQRKSNVMAMRWADIDFSSSTWSIQASETKQRKRQNVALSSKALALLATIERTSEFVFPSPRSKSGHIERIEHVWGQLRKEAGVPSLRPNDLRHTCGTWLGQAGANSFAIQKQLGHSNITTTRRYTHLNTSDVLPDLERSQRL